MIKPLSQLPKGTILGFDFGLKKIGIATGQTITYTAKPLSIITAQNGIPDPDVITKLFAEWQPVACVVGLPFNADGSASDLVPKAKKFGNRLNANFKVPVFFFDEHLSSHEARQVYNKKSKAPIDDVAAMIILESWLQTLQRGELDNDE